MWIEGTQEGECVRRGMPHDTRCECRKANNSGETGPKPAVEATGLMDAWGRPRAYEEPRSSTSIRPTASIAVTRCTEQSFPDERGDSPTGKPDAGNPPVRFGGRGDRKQPVFPTPIRMQKRASALLCR